MANRYYRSQFNFSNSAKPVTLRAKAAIGASGAVTGNAPVSGTGRGIASISKVSTGVYDIVLDRPFNGLMMVKLMAIASSGVPAAPVMVVKSEQVSNSSSPKIRIQTNAATSASDTTLIATNPASGETLMIEIQLNDSSLDY